MCDRGAPIVCCTPAYAVYLGESIAEKGLKHRLKAAIFGAEAWSEEMCKSIEESLGIKAYVIYGQTELSCPGISFECEEQSGLHINVDHFIPEIIDPET